jgi:hypothetical protein
MPPAMPSGYEKSPDYAGPPPRWWEAVLFVLAIGAVIVFVLW